MQRTTVTEATQRRGALLAWAAAALFFTALAGANALRISPAGEAGNLQFLESFVFGIAFFLVWIALFGRAWPAVLSASLLFAWWWPAELYLRFQYQTPVSPQFLGMAMETNGGELREFLATFWPQLVLGCVVLAAVSLPAWVLCRRYPARWRHWSRWACLLAFPALAGIMYAVFESQEPDWLEAAPDPFRTEPLAFWSDKWRDVFPLTLPLALRRFQEDSARVARLREQVTNFKFGAQATGRPLDAVVLVIGESARADRWSLNGYGRQTNPLLEKRQNLVFLSNVVSQSISTRLAVPFIVARRPILSPDGSPATQPEPSLIAAFNEVGYRSAWLSNQSNSGFWDTSSAFYARDAHTARFMNPSTFEQPGNPDGVLLEPFAALLQGKQPLMVVVHTMGSHFQYANRYPPEFDRFQPSLKTPRHDAVPGARDSRESSNSYDNTILYTDYFLDQLMAQLNRDGRRSVLAYVSDHGEDVGESSCPATGMKRQGRWSYRVPALVWLSDALAREKEAELARLRQAAAAPLQSDSVFPMLLEIAGVRIADGAKMPAKGRMVFGGNGRWAGFDAAEKRDGCHIRRD
jgi:glucan phosphoethanolaminetransferase (alkaline phosphatase superfamily)